MYLYARKIFLFLKKKTNLAFIPGVLKPELTLQCCILYVKNKISILVPFLIKMEIVH